MNLKRIAFLTPEYVTRQNNEGGLASYVHNIARSLVALGHQVTVFVGDSPIEATLIHDQITVQHVPAADNHLTRTIGKLARCHWRINDFYRGSLKHMRMAAGLAKALESVHRHRPFDLVQSSEFGLSGLFVPRNAHRQHLVRCSSAGDLLVQISLDRPGWDTRLLMALERHCIARADVAYAPSRFTAEHYRRRFGLKVDVLRPPLFPSKVPPQRITLGLAGKYLLFFGKLGRIKGSDVLAHALKMAWQQEPNLTMVWAGAEAQAGVWQQCCRIMGDRAGHVHWLGAVERCQLPSIIAQAHATVLPSRCDNLPNTLLESLSLGVPVIGSTAGGFDEIIEPGFNGKLIPSGNPTALAQALVATWRGDMSHLRGKDLRTPAMREMDPPIAARNLLHLAAWSKGAMRSQPACLREAA